MDKLQIPNRKIIRSSLG